LEPFLADPAPVSHPGDILKLKVKARLQRVGREMKLGVHNAEDRAAADPGLLRIVARAHDFHERLIQDPNLTVPAIASQERLWRIVAVLAVRGEPVSLQNPEKQGDFGQMQG